MFTLVMMTALSGSPDAVQFGGRSNGCSGGSGVLGGLTSGLGGLFHRGGKGYGCHGPVVTGHSACDCCGPVSVPAVPSCCGDAHHHAAPGVTVMPAAPAPVPLPATPAATSPPAAMPGAAPPATTTPPAKSGTF